jgi:hypothetical protein
LDETVDTSGMVCDLTSPGLLVWQQTHFSNLSSLGTMHVEQVHFLPVAEFSDRDVVNGGCAVNEADGLAVVQQTHLSTFSSF